MEEAYTAPAGFVLLHAIQTALMRESEKLRSFCCLVCGAAASLGRLQHGAFGEIALPKPKGLLRLALQSHGP